MTQIRLLCCWAITFILIVSAFVFDHARLVELASVDHVGLGTDMDSNFKPVFSRYLQMPNWRKGLIKKNFPDVEVSKIIVGNAQRLLAQVLG